MNDARDPIAACAATVEQGDPDRFLAATTGSVDERKRLFPLYAFNLEIARAPYMTQEPMVAMIRLQFWRDVIENAVDGREAPPHDVATPLSRLILWGDLKPSPLLRMIEAREGDAQGAPRETLGQIRDYARETSGALMLAAAEAAGTADFTGETDVTAALEALGEAQGLANWFLAQPALKAAGRGHKMPDRALVVALAEAGLDQLKIAREDLPDTGNGALRSAWRARRILKRAKASPDLVEAGGIAEAEFVRRASLLWRGFRGRW